MKKPLIAVVLAIGAVSMSGCGTVCNFAGGIAHPDVEPRVYGGVLRDIQVIEDAVTCDPTQRKFGDPRAIVVVLPIAVADPIVSFIADTLTLPITIPLQERRIAIRKNAEEADNGPNSAGAATETPSLAESHQPGQAGEEQGDENQTAKPPQ